MSESDYVWINFKKYFWANISHNFLDWTWCVFFHSPEIKARLNQPIRTTQWSGATVGPMESLLSLEGWKECGRSLQGWVFSIREYCFCKGISVSLWFVWVRFGSRSVNEPEIGSVSVCIPTVCFVESKLIDANCLHMPYWLVWAWVQPQKSEVQRWKPSMGVEPRVWVQPRKVVLRDERYQWGVEPGCGFQFNPEKWGSEMKAINGGLNLGSEFNPEKLCSDMKGTSWTRMWVPVQPRKVRFRDESHQWGVEPRVWVQPRKVVLRDERYQRGVEPGCGSQWNIGCYGQWVQSR